MKVLVLVLVLVLDKKYLYLFLYLPFKKSTCTCTCTCSSGKYLYCTCTWANVLDPIPGRTIKKISVTRVRTQYGIPGKVWNSTFCFQGYE